MAGLGAFIEHCVGKFMPLSIIWNTTRYIRRQGGSRFGDLDYLKASLETVGPERCVIGTDVGQIHNPNPLEMFIYFLFLLERIGCSKKEIFTMAHENPRKLLEFNN